MAHFGLRIGSWSGPCTGEFGGKENGAKIASKLPASMLVSVPA